VSSFVDLRVKKLNAGPRTTSNGSSTPARLFQVMTEAESTMSPDLHLDLRYTAVTQPGLLYWRAAR
jgi:hypothetical protein